MNALRQGFVTVLFPAFAVVANITCGRLGHIIAQYDFVLLIDLVPVHKSNHGPESITGPGGREVISLGDTVAERG